MILSDDASLKRLFDEVEARPPGPADPMIDGLSPSLVLEPSTDEGCARALALCESERMAVVPLGGGTRLEVGNPPSRLDVYLSTRALTGILDHVEGDLTVAVPDGAPQRNHRDLRRTVDAHGHIAAAYVSAPAYRQEARRGIW